MSRSFKVVEGDLKKKSDKKNDNFLIVLKVINFRNRFPFLKKKIGQDHWAYLLRNNIILAYLGIASTHIYLEIDWTLKSLQEKYGIFMTANSLNYPISGFYSKESKAKACKPQKQSPSTCSNLLVIACVLCTVTQNSYWTFYVDNLLGKTFHSTCMHNREISQQWNCC